MPDVRCAAAGPITILELAEVITAAVLVDALLCAPALVYFVFIRRPYLGGRA